MSVLSLVAALIVGIITLTDANGAVVAAPGVGVTLTCAASVEPRVTSSDDDGQFRFDDVSSDNCTITTDLQGFVTETKEIIVHQDDAVSLTLHLVTTPIRVGIVVAGATATASTAKATKRKIRANTCDR